MSIPRFYVSKEKIQGKMGSIDGSELEHMRKVLRLRPGQGVILFDSEGWEHEAVIQSYTAGVAEVEILRSNQPRRESPLDIILVQAIGKGEKMDWVVEKATELGVRCIVPFFSTYTIPRLDAKKIEQRHARWEKIALNAAKQSGRTRIPEIHKLSEFGSLVRRPWSCDLKLLFWERASDGGFHRVREERRHLDSILLVIGPEGGFTSEEVAHALDQDFQAVQLGKRLLRTETAALGALSIIQFLWGDMG
ncbi:MAG: 16S rRNA (uracil(1498)-N(3))-methyltransferase [Candidatus Binatia bacterium]